MRGKILSSSMIRNVAMLLLRNYFPDDIKAGIVFTSKWKWDGCNERVVGEEEEEVEQMQRN